MALEATLSAGTGAAAEAGLGVVEEFFLLELRGVVGLEFCQESRDLEVAGSLLDLLRVWLTAGSWPLTIAPSPPWRGFGAKGWRLEYF